jgi:hypothetical protein
MVLLDDVNEIFRAHAEEDDLSPLEEIGVNHGSPPSNNKKLVSLLSSKTSRLFLQHNPLITPNASLLLCTPKTSRLFLQHSHASSDLYIHDM